MWDQVLAQGVHYASAGVVGFYGMPGRGRDGSPGPIDRVSQFECPVLGLMAGADGWITADHVQAFDGALTSAGVSHELVTYPGAPHSFFDRTYEEHAEASADAWRRILAFVRQIHAGKTATPA